MAAIPGAGPVFEFEWLTTSRRWQHYALRALFVTALLVALGMSWQLSSVPANATVRQAGVHLATRASLAIVGTQLALVLLAAPAATAGSICIDKARGTLAHLFVTDLSDAEIVLGKLAARLVPVLGLIGCTLPFVALCTLLGGIDPVALAGAYAVSAALAVLCCSLALALSVWASKTHEVLLATYLILVVWLLARPASRAVSWAWFGFEVPGFLDVLDPIRLTLGAYGPPSSAPATWEIAAFCALCLLISAALVSLAVRRVREVARRDAGRVSRPKRADRPRGRHHGAAWPRRLDWFGGPSLDRNPVLWREWHRNRPSRWARRTWAVYFAGSALFMVIALVEGGRVSLWVNGFQVAIGILLLSVGASTSLAEERARGSLDVLMATPMSTRSIVWGKWLGGFRRVPGLAVLPAVLATRLCLRSGHWPTAPLLIGEIVAYGAFVTSLGVAVATWVPRLGRAVAICVAIDVLATVGSFFLIFAIFGPSGEHLLAVSPFGGPAILTADADGFAPRRWRSRPHNGILWDLLLLYGWEILSIAAYSLAALVLLGATLRTFNACLGRVDTLPGSTPPPRSIPGQGPRPAHASHAE